MFFKFGAWGWRTSFLVRACCTIAAALTLLCFVPREYVGRMKDNGHCSETMVVAVAAAV